MLLSAQNVSTSVRATEAGKFGVRTLQSKEICEIVIRAGLARVGSNARYKA